MNHPTLSGNPYQIEGPALISFSGGRTSAFMLWRILEAHGGHLPDDVHVVFANTGKEREETLRFVHECGSRWGVRVRWLEWKDREGRNTLPADRFDEVGLNSAARRGEPFKALIRRKAYLPNAVTRFCTAELKIDTMKQFMLAQGYQNWTNVVGLRLDEMRRVLKQIKRNDEGKERWQSLMPMVRGGVTKQAVWSFWLGENADPKRLTSPLPQGFDLGLYPYEGNCDGCFLKGVEVLGYQERERPGYLDDWIEMEALASSIASNPAGARFVTEYSYADIKRNIERQELLIPLDWRNLEFDAECGVGGTDTQIRCGARKAA
jgi:3'-phosphoadenosine 5'-phosphosulfate sulfotransferase (PAPS reductase)/FAD synthetase